MKFLICDLADEEKLRRLARRQPHPYRILRSEAGFRLLIEAASPGVIADVQKELGDACAVWELVEEGCREAGDA